MSESDASLMDVADRSLVVMIKPSNDDVCRLLINAAGNEILVGRRDRTYWDGVDRLYVDDRYMSRRHCRLFWNDSSNSWSIEDLNSANGTIAGGVSLQEPCAIDSGVLLQLGTSLVRIQPAKELPASELDEVRRATAELEDKNLASQSAGSSASEQTRLGVPDDNKTLFGRLSAQEANSTLVREATVLGAEEPDFSRPTVATAIDPALDPDANAQPVNLDDVLTEMGNRSDSGEPSDPEVQPAPETDGQDLLDELDFGDLDDLESGDLGDSDATKVGAMEGESPRVDSIETDLAETQLEGAATLNAQEIVEFDDVLTDVGLSESDAESTGGLDPDATFIGSSSLDAIADGPPGLPSELGELDEIESDDQTRLASGQASGQASGDEATTIGNSGDVSTFVPESEDAEPEATQIGGAVVYEAFQASDSQVDTDRTQDADATLIGSDVDNNSYDIGVAEGATSGNVKLVGMAQRLVEAGLMDQTTAVELTLDARAHGKTFFRTMAESRAARFIDEIYQWVSEQYGYEVLASETDLFDQVIETPTISLQQTIDNGVLLLQPDSSAPTRVAMVDPFDVMTLDWVKEQVGWDISIAVARTEAMLGAIERIKNTGLETEEIGLVIDLNPEQEQHINDHMGDIDIPQMVNYFLHRASLSGASDIHIEPTEDRMLVRFRVNGILYEERSLSMAHHLEIASRLKIMSGMNVAEKRRPQDGRIGGVIRGKQIDVRVSTFPTVHGEKIVMRLLDKSALRPSPEHLGLLPRDLRLLKEKIHAPFGLVMISGPTGSGKTTTLYSCLGSIDKTQKNVLTVEDPVEYQMQGVHQMQVNHKINLTFASGLRTILRQDPDVIMVGECRDRETAEMAIQASMTGHIVFSTIHTNDAIGVVTRLIDMGIEPFLVASALSLSIAQRLVREVCPHCKTTVMGEEIIEALARDGITESRLEALGVEIDEDLDYAEGKGCKHCRFTGYSQRRAVFEIFEITDEVRSIIVSSDYTDQKLREVAASSGMTTLIDHGLKLVDDEVTTFYEVIRVLGESI